MDFNIVNFSRKRKKWISWILRTRNGWKFLENIVQSCIQDLDELIIINNNSNDETEDIIKKLIKEKYSKKIKYYFYPYEINREDFNTWSIYSFAYYSNWSISLANYNIVVKIDDDNLFIKDIFTKQVSKVRKISSIWSYFYYYYWWVNIYKKNNVIWVVWENPYSGIYWDIWFFKISNRTYFIQKNYSEILITPYFSFNLWFSYLHLKYFKEGNGLNYAPKKLKHYFSDLLQKTDIDPIEKYTKKLTKNDIDYYLETILTNNH